MKNKKCMKCMKNKKCKKKRTTQTRTRTIFTSTTPTPISATHILVPGHPRRSASCTARSRPRYNPNRNAQENHCRNRNSMTTVIGGGRKGREICAVNTAEHAAEGSDKKAVAHSPAGGLARVGSREEAGLCAPRNSRSAYCTSSHEAHLRMVC